MISIIFFALQVITYSEQRMCNHGEPLMKNQFFIGSLPGMDDNGYCFINYCNSTDCSVWSEKAACLTCRKNACLFSNSIEVKGCTRCVEEEVYELHANKGVINMNSSYLNSDNCIVIHPSSIPTKKKIIKKPTNVYCTSNSICGFEKIELETKLYQTREPSTCHKIPLAVATTGTGYIIFKGNKKQLWTAYSTSEK